MATPEYAIRAAQASELSALQAIEEVAGQRYGSVGIDPDLPGLPLPTLAAGQRAGLLWVMVHGRNELVGFALAWVRPDAVHLREIDVLPAHGGKRLGARLVDRVASEARMRSLARVTLTTFADVPWNAPYYERLGFRRLDDAELPSWLRAIRAEEHAAGLDTWPRVAMARDVTPNG